MAKLKIKSGDTVIVTAGDHKGSEGKVMKVILEKNKAIVEGVNMVSKHEKPSATSPQGGIVKKEAALHISNLSLVDPKTGTATRVGYRMEEGKKSTFYKKIESSIIVMAYLPRLKEEYKSRVIEALKEEFGYSNVMQVPKLERIVVSRGVGAAVADKKLLEYAVDELTNITGQKAVATISKKDVANFKLRKGVPIGAKVTLRGERMYEFLDRLVTSALPRVRDFNGIKATGFDGRGNYSLGVTEQIIFPEINIDKIKKIDGMNITFVTSAGTDKEAKSLLTELGLPFKKN